MAKAKDAADPAGQQKEDSNDTGAGATGASTAEANAAGDPKVSELTAGAASPEKPGGSPPPSVDAASGAAGAAPDPSAPKDPAPGSDAPAAPAAGAGTAEAAAAEKAKNDAASAQAEADRVAAESAPRAEVKPRTLLSDLDAQVKAHVEAGEHQAAAAIEGLKAKFVDVLHHVTTALKNEEIKLQDEAREMFEYFKAHI